MKPIDLKDGCCPHLKHAVFAILPSYYYCKFGDKPSTLKAYEPCMSADAARCHLAKNSG